MKYYRSKKDETVIAKLIKESDNGMTVMLESLSGKKTVSVSTGTLKRWWVEIPQSEVPVSETPEPTVLNTVDYEKVNEPYPEPSEKKYIPKPASVVEYEAKKARSKGFNDTLPTQEQMVEQFGSKLAKINKTYIVFQNGCWLERKSGYTNLYATEEVWTTLSEKGLQARANGMKNTKLKFVFQIETKEQYDIVASIFE